MTGVQTCALPIWVSWNFKVFNPGTFEVIIHTVAAKYKDWVGGHRVRLKVGSEELAGVIRPDEIIESPRTRYYEERATILGTVEISSAGSYRLEIGAERINDKDPAGLCLSEIRLRQLRCEG